MTTTHYLSASRSSQIGRQANWFARDRPAALRIALAFALGAAGLQKLAGSRQMVHMFSVIGAGQWLRYFVGRMGVLGAVGLLIPRLAGVSASAAAALLVGATITNVAVLHTSPALPLLFFAVAAVIAYTCRADLINPIMKSRV